MGQNARQTVEEIERTREQLAHKVDLLVDQARVQASEVGKKAAVVALAFAGLLVVGFIAKRRVR